MSDANINDVLGRTQREDRAAFDRAQAELTALRKVAEALQVYVADWDSQVSDPRAACYQCEDPEHIKQFRAALAEWRRSK